CLKCCICKRTLTLTTYVIVNNQLYCQKHSTEDNNKKLSTNLNANLEEDLKKERERKCLSQIQNSANSHNIILFEEKKERKCVSQLPTPTTREKNSRSNLYESDPEFFPQYAKSLKKPTELLPLQQQQQQIRTSDTEVTDQTFKNEEKELKMRPSLSLVSLRIGEFNNIIRTRNGTVTENDRSPSLLDGELNTFKRQENISTPASPTAGYASIKEFPKVSSKKENSTLENLNILLSNEIDLLFSSPNGSCEQMESIESREEKHMNDIEQISNLFALKKEESTNSLSATFKIENFNDDDELLQSAKLRNSNGINKLRILQKNLSANSFLSIDDLPQSNEKLDEIHYTQHNGSQNLNCSESKNDLSNSMTNSLNYEMISKAELNKNNLNTVIKLKETEDSNKILINLISASRETLSSGIPDFKNYSMVSQATSTNSMDKIDESEESKKIMINLISASHDLLSSSMAEINNDNSTSQGGSATSLFKIDEQELSALSSPSHCNSGETTPSHTPSKRDTLKKNRNTKLAYNLKKNEKSDYSAKAWNTLAGTPETLELLRDLYVKASDEVQCILNPLGKLEKNSIDDEENIALYDKLMLLFGYFFNTAKRIYEISKSCVCVVKLKKKMAELSKAEKEFRLDYNKGSRNSCKESSDSIKCYTDSINETLTVISDLLDGYEEAEKMFLAKPSAGFRIEALGEIVPNENPNNKGYYEDYRMEHLDEDAIFYFRKHFFNTEHKTFVGITDKLGAIIVSLKMEQKKESRSSNSNTSLSESEIEEDQWRAILRMKESDDIRVVIPTSTTNQSVLSRTSTRNILLSIHPQIQPSKLHKVNESNLEQRLLKLDEMKFNKKYKFGVLYCKSNQTTEEEIFGNEFGSQSYERFLEILGKRVKLKGFQGFKAGLDTENGQTGEETIYIQWRNFEITYHVSTLLPYSTECSQQIQRKRHIGNDIVCIVFLDGDCQFDPACIKSQFLHIYIIVKEELSDSNVLGYRVMVTTNTDVGFFGPTLTQNGTFFNKNELLEFLLTKMINGENSAYKAPKFQRPQTRARNAMIDEVLKDFSKKERSDGLSRKESTKSISSFTGAELSISRKPSVSNDQNEPFENPVNLTRARHSSIFGGGLGDKLRGIMQTTSKENNEEGSSTLNLSLKGKVTRSGENMSGKESDEDSDDGKKKKNKLKQKVKLKVKTNSEDNYKAESVGETKLLSKSQNELSIINNSPTQITPTPGKSLLSLGESINGSPTKFSPRSLFKKQRPMSMCEIKNSNSKKSSKEILNENNLSIT
ncbi:hypothetical protein HK099_008509, partial [Clydaea vesicula]